MRYVFYVSYANLCIMWFVLFMSRIIIVCSYKSGYRISFSPIIHQLIYRFIYQSIYQFLHLFIYQFTYQFIHRYQCTINTNYHKYYNTKQRSIWLTYWDDTTHPPHVLSSAINLPLYLKKAGWPSMSVCTQSILYTRSFRYHPVVDS